MSDWKPWLLACALLGVMACSAEEGLDIPGGGGGAATAGDGGRGGAAQADAGKAGPKPGGPGGKDDPKQPGGPGGKGEECAVLHAVIRDFTDAHPDFQKFFGGSETRGLVAETLGADNKPVFASVGRPAQISSAESFGQWFQDVPGVNKAVEVEIPLTQNKDGASEYRNTKFFPIDLPKDADGFFGTYMNTGHNFHFTTEIHTEFTFTGNETFTFSGDDDLWIFVNGKLALDLGGLHGPIERTIDFNAQAEKLGIVPGQEYRMDIFHAERRTEHSNFRITTTISCFQNVFI